MPKFNLNVIALTEIDFDLLDRVQNAIDAQDALDARNQRKAIEARAQSREHAVKQGGKSAYVRNARRFRAKLEDELGIVMRPC